MSHTLHERLTSIPSITAAGFTTLDIIVTDVSTWRRYYRAGGTAGNVAAILAFMGVTSHIVARTGSDAFGRMQVSDLTRAGVDVKQIARSSPNTTAVVEIVGDGGQHSFRFSCPMCGKLLSRARPATVRQALNARELVSKSHLFFFDRATKANLILAEEAKRAGRLVMFEPPSTRSASSRRALEISDIVKLSVGDDGAGSTLTSRDFLSKRQLRILTRGASGLDFTICTSGTESYEHLPGYIANTVRDTAGAGDWCSAGFVYSLINDPEPNFSSEKVRHWLSFGQALGALSVAYTGPRGLMDILSRTELFALASQTIEQLAVPIEGVRKERASEGEEGPSGAGCCLCLQ